MLDASNDTVAHETEAYIADVMTDIVPNIASIVKELDLTLVTGEGDLLHQFVDCMFLGALNSTLLAPADTAGVMENLMYSRSANATDRNFELPCQGSLVYDRTLSGNAPFTQKTCGSDTRISVMAYVTQEILYKDDGGLHTILIDLIRTKIAAISDSITDSANYGCLGQKSFASWKHCCLEVRNCLPYENTFEPNLPDVDYEISIPELLQALQDSIGDIGKKAIVDSEVCGIRANPKATTPKTHNASDVHAASESKLFTGQKQAIDVCVSQTNISVQTPKPPPQRPITPLTCMLLVSLSCLPVRNRLLKCVFLQPIYLCVHRGHDCTETVL